MQQKRPQAHLACGLLRLSIFAMIAAYRSKVIISLSNNVFAIVLCIKISNDSDLVSISATSFHYI